MQQRNQSTQSRDPLAWQLRRGQVVHQGPGRAQRLRVHCGLLWATQDARPGDAQLPQDLLLDAGAELRLARGEGLVIEAFEDSRFSWLPD